MMSDLEERERSVFATHDSYAKATSEEEMIGRELKEEISRIHAMHAKKSAATATEGMLKVLWAKGGLCYSAQRLRELFETFGEVKYVVVSSKKKRSALVVMATKEAAMDATGTMCGDILNPLLVVLLQPAAEAREPVGPQLNVHLDGAGYQAFEDSVLQKVQKAAEMQKESNRNALSNSGSSLKP